MVADRHEPGGVGILLHSPRHYDLQVWLATRGREAWLRQTILDKARLAGGETLLDVGCGTGTLAIAAKRRLGASGRVFGVDASAEMVAAARAKAFKAGLDIVCQAAPAQALPFADASFDLVTSTLMLHHLARPAQTACVDEIRRVLKPGGRTLAVDFASSSAAQGGFLGRLHRHGRVKPEQISALLTGGGLTVLDRGPIGMRDLHYVLAIKPNGAT
jgi:ubiquinone/menaquinone biosynthesis C-methylase UbiE